jgi:hypothetical protein
MLTLRKALPGAQALLRLADRLEPAVRRQFLDALLRIYARIDLRALQAMLEQGESLERIFDALQQEFDPALRTALRDAIFGGGQVAMRQARLGMRFDLTNTRAAEAAEQAGAQLAQDVTAESRAAIRDLMGRAIREGWPPRDVARRIREHIGLTPRWSQAVENFRAAQAARGVPAGQADARATRYAARLTRLRAEMIARTETLRAVNTGQRAAWESAQQAGELSPEARRVWIVTDDERLCPRCAPLEGQEVLVGQPFATDEGALMEPPLHPQCRCTTGLVFSEE